MAKSVPNRNADRSIPTQNNKDLVAELHAYKLRNIQGWHDAKGLPMGERLKMIKHTLDVEHPQVGK
jgi:hypothetical protein